MYVIKACQIRYEVPMLRDRIARLAVAALLALGAAGRGGDDEPTAATPTSPTAQPAETPAPPASGANAFIGSIAVDPENGTVMIGTGLGLYRLKARREGRAAHRR